ncbi:MAG: YceD family protein [Hydrogenophaga sp.]
MTADAKSRWNPDRFDVRAFAQAGAELAADDPLARFARLAAEMAAGQEAQARGVQWRVQGEQRPGVRGAEPSVWLHVQAQTVLPLVCQRCLAPVDTPLTVDRWFRFVADEDTAAAEDEDSDEDVLALEPRPSLRELVEDELLMELPPVPMHEVCPEPLSPVDALAPADPAGADTQRPHPFAGLARLKQ